MGTKTAEKVTFSAAQKRVIEKIVRQQVERIGSKALTMNGYGGNNGGTVLRSEILEDFKAFSVSDAIRNAQS